MRIHVTLGIAILATAGLGFAQDKPTVAVIDFDYATVQSGVAALFGSNQDAGKGIADLMVDKLVKSGQWRVIERKAIGKILAEQNFSNSDRADPSSAAKIGKLLGADVIMIGSITQFGRDDKQSNVGSDVIGSRLGRYGIGGVGQKKSKAVVGLSARLVSVNTGEILSVASGKGESTRSGTSILGGGGSAGAAANAAFDMTSSNFADTLLGEAVHTAATQVVGEFDKATAKIPVKQVHISALVADVSGNTLIINTGTKGGIKVGDKLAVKRVGREIRDPASGKVIRRVEESLGELTVTEADEASAVGTFAGSATVNVGDSVQNK